MATSDSTAVDLGDEPFQFYRKFKNLDVAVDEKRVRGIETLQQIKPDLDLVLLDDAFQHRYVKAGKSYQIFYHRRFSGSSNIKITHCYDWDIKGSGI